MVFGFAMAGISDPAMLLTVGVAAVMVRLGFDKDTLERKHPGWCGSCGRRLEGGRCPSCTRR
jgi:hypothetical protein